MTSGNEHGQFADNRLVLAASGPALTGCDEPNAVPSIPTRFRHSGDSVDSSPKESGDWRVECLLLSTESTRIHGQNTDNSRTAIGAMSGSFAGQP